MRGLGRPLAGSRANSPTALLSSREERVAFGGHLFFAEISDQGLEILNLGIPLFRSMDKLERRNVSFDHPELHAEALDTVPDRFQCFPFESWIDRYDLLRTHLGGELEMPIVEGSYEECGFQNGGI